MIKTCRLILGPLKRHFYVLSSRDLWVWPYFEIGLWQMGLVEMSYCCRVPLIQCDWVLIRRETETDTREGQHVITEAEIGLMHLWARKAGCQRHREWEAWNILSPGTFRERMALTTPWCWASGLQNCKRIDFCYKSPSLWYFDSNLEN